MQCITSWLREVSVETIVNSPLLDVIFGALEHDAAMAEATDCLCAIFKETGEIDENLATIELLFPRVVRQQPRIAKAVEEEDSEAFKNLTKFFSAAAEAWVIAIVRQPTHFRPLVDAVLECAARDKDVEVIEHTFEFWYQLKQYLVIERYIEARVETVHVYSKLVDIMLKHLEYPTTDSGSDQDPFAGDREQEEKFREFRHHMGDTLKDACEVMGVTECLTKVLEAINVWLQKYAGQVHGTNVPHWQQLEAPLFAMRALGRMVHKDEDIVLKHLMPLLVQIPSHEKLLFATIMVLGRYTEWTSAHPEFFESQFTYVTAAFQHQSQEVIRAAAVAIKFFCTDCRDLLTDQVLQLQVFYNAVLDRLPELSQEEMTEGVASVVAAQPVEDIYKLLKLYCDPLVQRMVEKAKAATDEKSKLALAGRFPWKKATDQISRRR
jgi:transportin-3